MGDVEDKLVDAVRALAPAGWRRIVAHWLVEDDDGHLVTMSLIFAVVQADGATSAVGLRNNDDVEARVRALHQATKESGRALTVLDLEIDHAGGASINTYDSGWADVDVDPAYLKPRDYAAAYAAGELPMDRDRTAPQLSPKGLSGKRYDFSAAPAERTPLPLSEHLQLITDDFTAAAPEDWARLVGNWECGRDEQGELFLNYVTVAVVNGGDRWLFGQIDFYEPLYDAVLAMNEDAAASDESKRWTTFDVTLDADGKLTTEFGYDPPKRINGIMDDESFGRFNNYLETWVAEKGPRP